MNIKTKVRALVEDIEKQDKEVFVFRNTDTFTLAQPNITSIVAVYIKGTALGSGDYTWYSTTNKITIETSLTTGDVVEVHFKAYFQYSDTELTEYIRGALVHIGFNGYKNFTISGSSIDPEPTTAEEDLIALIASMLINPDYSSYRLPNVAVTYHKRDMDLDEKIAKFIASYRRLDSSIYDVFKNIEIQ